MESCTFPFLVLDYPNLNGRVYTKKVGNSIIDQFKSLKLPLYGELQILEDGQILDHSVIDLKNSSHIVKELSYVLSANYDKDNNFLGVSKNIITAKIEFLENENGKFAYNMRDKLSLSLRAKGTVEPWCYIDNKTGMLEGECLGRHVKDCELVSIDLILTKDSSFKDVF